MHVSKTGSKTCTRMRCLNVSKQKELIKSHLSPPNWAHGDESNEFTLEVDSGKSVGKGIVSS